MTQYFISAGWPYLYDVPGLHNCVPMLFADVYARFLRQEGHEVFFLCGGDEHGSRIEFVAHGYGKQPQELVNEKYDATLPLLKKLGISLNQFGRTSDTGHKQWVRDFISRLIASRKLYMKDQQVPYCPRCSKYLPDRFIEGKCPFCGDATYGGQCNNKRTCGRMIESVNEGRCALCSGPYELKERTHLMFRLSDYGDQVLPNIVSDRNNLPTVIERTKDTFETVDEVSITRDSGWGIDVTEYRISGQSVYSWVDSLLAKVSFSAASGQDLLWKDGSTQRMFFLGMDGVPFYGALFPALLLAAGEDYSITNWTLLPNEVFIYEGGVCSKSTGTGIWLPEALAVLEPDLWRFYVYYSYTQREKDADFRWEKFAEAINRYLVNGLQAAVERFRHHDDSSLELPSSRIGKARDHLLRFEAPEAFGELLNLIVDPGLTEASFLEALPLLSCFLPDLGGKAHQLLTGTLSSGRSIVTLGRIDAREIRTSYQKLVDDRRSKQELQEEITNMRADFLCVCPTSLNEQ